MRPYALVEIEDGVESNRRVVGESDISVIVIDWDMVESDGTAQELIDEIEAQYLPGETPTARDQEVIDRLKAIVNEDEDEDEDEECCPDCGESDCYGECVEDDEDEVEE